MNISANDRCCRQSGRPTPAMGFVEATPERSLLHQVGGHETPAIGAPPKSASSTSRLISLGRKIDVSGWLYFRERQITQLKIFRPITTVGERYFVAKSARRAPKSSDSRCEHWRRNPESQKARECVLYVCRSQPVGCSALNTHMQVIGWSSGSIHVLSIPPCSTKQNMFFLLDYCASIIRSYRNQQGFQQGILRTGLPALLSLGGIW